MTQNRLIIEIEYNAYTISIIYYTYSEETLRDLCSQEKHVPIALCRMELTCLVSLIDRHRETWLLFCTNHSSPDWRKPSMGGDRERCDHFNPTD